MTFPAATCSANRFPAPDKMKMGSSLHFSLRQKPPVFPTAVEGEFLTQGGDGVGDDESGMKSGDLTPSAMMSYDESIKYQTPSLSKIFMKICGTRINLFLLPIVFLLCPSLIYASSIRAWSPEDLAIIEMGFCQQSSKVCEVFTRKGDWNGHYKCVMQVSLYTLDPANCDPFRTGKIKWPEAQCVGQIARKVNNPKLCDRISDPILREKECLTNRFEGTFAPAAKGFDQYAPLKGWNKNRCEEDLLGLDTQLKALSAGETSITLTSHLITDRELKRLGEILGASEINKLNLQNTSITSLASLSKLRYVSELRLTRSDITDAGLRGLSEWMSLRKLDLSQTGISDDGLRFLKDLVNLEDVNLNHTKITDKGMTYLRGLKKLKRLNLGFTKVTNAGLRQLAPLPKLIYVDRMGTSLSESVLLELKKDYQHMVLFINVGGSNINKRNLTFEELTPDDIDYLTNQEDINQLILKGYKLSDSTISKLGSMKHLETLSLMTRSRSFPQGGRPHLTVKGLKNLANIPGLNRINFFSADLDATVLAEIARWPQIEHMAISSTFKNKDLAALSASKTLHTLELNGKEFSNEAVGHVAKIAGLRTLRMIHTSITNEGLAPLVTLNALEELDLRQCLLSDGALPGVPSLKKLRILNLSWTLVGNETLQSLLGIPLVKLDLSKTRITDRGLAHLSKIEELTNLNLKETSVTDKGLNSLLALPRLQHLTVGKTNVTKEGSRAFHQAYIAKFHHQLKLE